MLAQRVRPMGRIGSPRSALALAVLGLTWFVPGCALTSGTPATSVSSAAPTSIVTATIVDTIPAGDTPAGGCEGQAEQSAGTATDAGGLSLESWVAPSADIVAAFAGEAARVDCPVYVPTRLPPGSALVGAGEGLSGLSEGGAQSVVRLTTELGSIEIAQGVAGDVGDLPGEPCGVVAGRPAAVYRMLGGHLVQWSDPPWWYGVFSEAMSKEAVIVLARGMVRSEDPDDR